jgi:hypothetical protein
VAAGEAVYDQIDIDEKSEVFMEIIIKYFNCAFPLRKIVIIEQIKTIKLICQRPPDN